MSDPGSRHGHIEGWRPPPEAAATFSALVAGGHFGQAEALLDEVLPTDPDPDPGGHHTTDRAAFYEAWGDHRARRGDVVGADQAYEVAEGQWRRFASWATAGGEGLARMLDVDRVVAKRQHLRARP